MKTKILPKNEVRSSTAHLAQVLDLLNWEQSQSDGGDDLSEDKAELRKLVDAWFRSGPDLWKLTKENRILRKRLAQPITAELIFDGTGGAHVVLTAIPWEYDHQSPYDRALAQFITLITHPTWNKLSGPCRRCDRYYLKKTARQKAYCGRRCGSAATASMHMRERRANEARAKLLSAKNALAEWMKSSRRTDWKLWVANKSGISPHWLTRAVNSGKLDVPTHHQERHATRARK